MPVVQIRSARVTDADAIGETHAASSEHAYRDLFESGFLARSTAGRRSGWQYSIRRIIEPPNVLLVADFEGSVRAFAHAAPAESASSTTSANRELFPLYVQGGG